MPERQTKKQRIDEAREAARLAREKRERRQKLLKWLVPTLVSVAVLGIAAIIVAVVVIVVPQNENPGSPANMASDGILFEGSDGEIVPVESPARDAGEAPVESDPGGDIPHIQSYVDWSCPACKSFEEAYGPQIEELVAAGDATYEVHPVAILDRAWQGSEYSSRSANAAACVASEAPDQYLASQTAMYANQPTEGTTGFTDEEIVGVLADAGVDDPTISSCIEDRLYDDWVQASTQRVSGDEDLQGPQGFSTPTVLVNGERFDLQSGQDFIEFVQAAA